VEGETLIENYIMYNNNNNVYYCVKANILHEEILNQLSFLT